MEIDRRNRVREQHEKIAEEFLAKLDGLYIGIYECNLFHFLLCLRSNFYFLFFFLFRGGTTKRDIFSKSRKIPSNRFMPTYSSIFF